MSHHPTTSAMIAKEAESSSAAVRRAPGQVDAEVSLPQAIPEGVFGLDLSPIRRLLKMIEERCRPVAVWLFGSRAKGTAAPESDWDLLVVLPDSVPFEQQDKVVDPIQLRGLSRVNADIVSCGESDFKTARNIPNTLAYEIARTGFPVHEH